MSRGRTLARRVAELGIAALLLCAPSLARAQVWQPSEDDFLLLQLTVENYRMAQDVRGYQTADGVCLDLADVIQSLDLPIRLDKTARRATGWLFAEDQQITIDRSAKTVQTMNDGSAPLADAIVDTPEGWCVDTRALSRWFGVAFRPDLYNAAVRLESDHPLPFIEAIERRSRAARLRPKKPLFDLARYPRADTEYRVWRTPSVDVNLRLGYSSAKGTGGRTSARYELFAAGEIAGTSVDARVASSNGGQPDSLRVRAYRFDPEARLLGRLKATQVVVGDAELDSGQLTGQTAVGRGLFLGNQPFARPSRFSATSFRGTLPGGWDAELYRNGQLIGSQGDDDGDGRYEFLDVDLYFGRNDFELVLYGPQGQVRRERLSHPVGRTLIEPGRLEYWAGLVQANRDLIDLRAPERRGPGGAWRWGSGAEYGLDDRTSIAAGYQSFVLGGLRSHYAEAAVTRSLGAFQAELAGAYQLDHGAVVQGNVLGKLGPVNFGLDALWVAGAFDSEFVTSRLDYQAGLRFDTSLRLGHFRLPLQGGIGRTRLRDGTTATNWQLASAVGLGGINLSAQLDRQVREDGTGSGLDARTRLGLLANVRVLGLRVRGSAGLDLDGEAKGLQFVRLATDKDLDERSSVAFETEYEAPDGIARFRLGYSRRFDRFALRANADYASDGAIGANLALTFSFGPDPLGGGVRFSQSRLARFGQAAVTVFRDDDGDGRLGPGEERLEDVGVEAGFRTTDAVTRADGQAIVDELSPFVPVLVGVDEASLGDPYLAPATKGVVVVPRPGVTTRVELPISPSGEIEGEILSAAGSELGGAGLELLDTRGEVVATTVSEFDGFFLFERVPYGRYRLRLSNGTARALGASDALAAEIRLGRDADVARLGVIKLVPARIAARDGGNDPGAAMDRPSSAP